MEKNKNIRAYRKIDTFCKSNTVSDRTYLLFALLLFKHSSIEGRIAVSPRKKSLYSLLNETSKLTVKIFDSYVNGYCTFDRIISLAETITVSHERTEDSCANMAVKSLTSIKPNLIARNVSYWLAQANYMTCKFYFLERRYSYREQEIRAMAAKNESYIQQVDLMNIAKQTAHFF